MYLRRVSAQNFLSFLSLDYDFLHQPVFVEGKNLTEVETQESNGSGKSSLLSIVSYLLLQDSLKKSDIRDCDLITFGQEKSIIRGELYCPMRREVLTIQRTLLTKGSTKLSLSRIKDSSQESEDIPFANINDGNSKILEWIGISKEDLKNYFFVNTSNYKSFFSSSNTDKLALISRFSHSDKIDAIFPLLETELQEENEKKSTLIREKLLLQGAIDSLDEEICSIEEEDFDTIKQRKIEMMGDSIRAKESGIKELKSNIEANLQSIREIDDQIKTLDKKRVVENKNLTLEKENISVYKKSITLLNDEITSTEYLIKRLREDKQNIEKDLHIQQKTVQQLTLSLDSEIECPACHHHWLRVGDMSPDAIREVLSSKKTNIDKLSSQIDNREEQENLLSIEIKNISLQKDSEKRTLEEIEEKCNRIQSSIRDMSIDAEELTSVQRVFRNSNSEHQSHIEIMENGIKSLNAEIKSTIREKSDKTLRIEDREKIKRQKVELLDVNQKRLLEEEGVMSSLEKWKLDFKKFKNSLAREQLQCIQNKINDFLKNVHCDMRVIIEGYKALASGDMREEINTTIVRDGLKKFGTFSRGERARLESAMIIALRDIINEINPYGGLDLLMIDEVFEGTDSIGLQLIMEGLLEKSGDIFLISHIPSRIPPQNTLTIVKENGYSHIQK